MSDGAREKIVSEERKRVELVSLPHYSSINLKPQGLRAASAISEFTPS